MLIIGIESASQTASVAIWQDNIIKAEYTVNNTKTHSQTLLPMLDEIMKMSGTSLGDADAVAVSGGPGSFTGLRIGSAMAKGLGLAADIPLVHVPTLDAMAYQHTACAMLICPMLDARRKNVFCGIYENNEGFRVLMESSALAVTELIEKLNAMGRGVLLLGDGVSACKDILEETLRVPYIMADAVGNRPRAGAVASLGAVYFSQGKAISSFEEHPDYLRLSQGEQARNARLAKEEQ